MHSFSACRGQDGDLLHPCVLENGFCRYPILWVRVEHLLDYCSTFFRLQVAKRLEATHQRGSGIREEVLTGGFGEL